MCESFLEIKIRKEFIDCRYNADCMTLLIKKYRFYDKCLNYFLAITSCGSIASWSVFKEYSLIWGIIIAISQVINSIKHLFAFNKNVHNLNARCYKLEALFLELEDLWYKVKEVRISNIEAETQLAYLKKRVADVTFFDDDDGYEFPEKILEKAREMTSDTMFNKYNIID